MMETLSAKTVQTRKPHPCWGCRSNQPSGTKMLRVVTADGGDLTAVYWCPICCRVLQDYGGDIDPYCEGFLEGEILDDFREYYDEAKMRCEQKDQS